MRYFAINKTLKLTAIIPICFLAALLTVINCKDVRGDDDNHLSEINMPINQIGQSKYFSQCPNGFEYGEMFEDTFCQLVDLNFLDNPVSIYALYIRGSYFQDDADLTSLNNVSNVNTIWLVDVTENQLHNIANKSIVENVRNVYILEYGGSFIAINELLSSIDSNSLETLLLFGLNPINNDISMILRNTRIDELELLDVGEIGFQSGSIKRLIENNISSIRSISIDHVALDNNDITTILSTNPREMTLGFIDFIDNDDYIVRDISTDIVKIELYNIIEANILNTLFSEHFRYDNLHELKIHNMNIGAKNISALQNSIGTCSIRKILLNQTNVTDDMLWKLLTLCNDSIDTLDLHYNKLSKTSLSMILDYLKNHKIDELSIVQKGISLIDIIEFLKLLKCNDVSMISINKINLNDISHDYNPLVSEIKDCVKDAVH